MIAGERGYVAARQEPYPDIEALVRATHEESARTAFRILGNRADTEDAVQSAYVRVMLNWPFVGSLRTAGEQHAYLRTVVKNEALQLIRRRYRRREDLGSDTTGRQPSADHLERQVQARQQLRFIWQAIGRLPAGSRDTVALYLAGYDYREIAAMQGVKVSTVRSHISNARIKLRREMPGGWEGEPT